jgi:hypothetical protein
MFMYLTQWEGFGRRPPISPLLFVFTFYWVWFGDLGDRRFGARVYHQRCLNEIDQTGQ